MNVAAYLSRPVTPLSDWIPPCEKAKKDKAKSRQQAFSHKNCKDANAAKHNQAADRYRSAMNGEWCSTRTIENRLGMSRSSCMPNLNKWLEMGLLEKRTVGGDDNWNRMKGFEWRFVGK